ncbi:hypothetical protein [Amycolatopsis sp. DG1A-15b]|uniref:hypothetical protein n=1 Tax=Amycolatopsis sp. DG1A-15b TaxID=3052846 RepID=UPI00255BC392|nr:hypothetical protein [Amycolatopsis sp. DG1A-15b]WIX85783.1 hypothetical protein QRY02_31840 [Amycolatopsis sp. DG1A-15b]WIX89772.1 hypothetical protein QRY02_04795 [Amycolatopsis sp. DG1A-15b]
MGDPVQQDDGDFDEFADLSSIEDETPTLDAQWRNEPDARFRFERKETKMALSVPRANTSQLLEAAVVVLLVAAATIAPSMTLKAVPEDLPVWAVVGMIALQLVVVIMMAARTFFKPGYTNRPSG